MITKCIVVSITNTQGRGHLVAASTTGNMVRPSHNRKRRVMLSVAQTIQNRNAAISAVAATTVAASQDCRHLSGRLGRHFGTQNLRRPVNTWIRDYLTTPPLYSFKTFRRRFRIPRATFFKLHKDLVEHFPGIWATQYNAARKRGITSQIKVLACLRKLGTARPLDDFDESAQMESETLRQYFRKFTECLIELYGVRFLNRRPSTSELVEIERRYSRAGFPGSVGALDCCKIIWKNCPHGHKGQYHNTKEGKLATIQVE